MSLLKVSSLKYVIPNDHIREFCHVQTYNTYDNIPYQRYLLYTNIGLVLERCHRSYPHIRGQYNAMRYLWRRLKVCCFV